MIKSKMVDGMPLEKVTNTELSCPHCIMGKVTPYDKTKDTTKMMNQIQTMIGKLIGMTQGSEEAIITNGIITFCQGG